MLTTLRLNEPFSIITLPLAGRERSLPWEKRFAWPRQGDVQLPFDARTRETRDAWAARLDHAVAHADRAVLLVAEGTACLASIWWARLSPVHYVSKVAGAMFFQPPPIDTLDRMSGQLFASPDAALPFPSLVVDEAPNGLALARTCGARLLDGATAPAGPAGMWRQAQRLIERLSAGVVEQDMRVLRSLGITDC
ncbi:alpha/beta hydrolase [Sphingomonadaceae bacterium jetA1]|jgi:hypothetical protein|uniref:alpha/beta hydrolase n=1 Tax=Facivitalis istanbulensis TaxID=3075838 RepID=UPI003488227E